MKTFFISWCLTLAVVVAFKCLKDDPIVSVEQGKLEGSIAQLVDGTSYFSFKGIPYAQAPIRFANDPIVSVEQGKLEGSVAQLPDGTPYFSFKGIPYAQAPLRFAASLPPQPWKGTYEAKKHGPVCPQYNLSLGKYLEGNESCLFLNVYSKSLNPDSKLPVMVFIHGGSLMYGSGDADYAFGPDFLIQHDVIVVTMNYRLEVLGFLCLDTPEIPGNAGMKDQVMALRWVQNNIAHFGGDPKKVTLFGESSGSSSTIFHMHSPMSKGLFHNAIAQSGVSINDWAIGMDPVQRAFRVGKYLGKDTNDTTELLEFLRSVPAIKLAGVTYNTLTADETHRGLPVHFVTVVEKKFKNVEPFLTQKPIDSLVEKKINDVPLMLGYNSEEGLIMLNEKLNDLNFTNANTQYLVPREIADRLSEDKVKEFGERIRKFYVGDGQFTRDDAQIVAHLYSDLHFVYGIHRFTHFYSSIKTTYMYRFSFETDLNLVKKDLGLTELKGVCHADELFYLFYSGLNKAPYEAQEKLKEIVFRVTKIWTDFSKTGNPTPENGLEVKWPPYTVATRDFLDINQKMTVGHYAEKDRVEFWNSLFCEAGLPCITNS